MNERAIEEGERQIAARQFVTLDDVMTPCSVPAVPNTPGTPRRTIRITDALWNAAAEKAAEKGETVSDVLRRALERYVKRP